MISNQKEESCWFGLKALSPFLVFVGSYLTLMLLFPFSQTSHQLTSFPIFSCILAIAYSFFTFREKISLNKKIQVFISGVENPTVIYVCFIFVFSSIFAHLLRTIGGMDSAIKICCNLIPGQFILPGLFVAISIFALSIGTSLGSIAAFMPIAVGISQELSIDPALMAGIVVSGSMLGDNLSMISDTTIAAIKVTGCNPYKKFMANAKLVLPSLLITVAILFWVGSAYSGCLPLYPDEVLTIADFTKILPYIAILIPPLFGLDVLVVLFLGAVFAASLGIFMQKLTFLQVVSSLFSGFYMQKSMVAMLLLVMFIAGLLRIIEHNGGINFLISRFKSRAKSAAGSEVLIALLVSVLDVGILRNAISILVAGPIAMQIASPFKIAKERVAALLDIFSCIVTGILPFSTQLLLAAAMANVTTLRIIPHLHYQFVIFFVSSISIFLTSINSEKTTVSSS